ncbi:MAG: SCO family protein [Polyangia bacterium]|jgi:protein SCO1/2
MKRRNPIAWVDKPRVASGTSTETGTGTGGTLGSALLARGRALHWGAVVLGLLAGGALGREARGDSIANSPPEVGIEEKLGQRVPLDLMLIDEQGERVALGKLIDKPTVLTLNYFRCAGLCTPLLNGVAEMLSRTDQIPGKDFRVLTVSFDPRDDAELASLKQANYLKQLPPGFPAEAWHFMTGDPVSTKRLADAVGFHFAKRGDDYVHAGAIMVLSPSGKITRYLYGITFLPFDVKMAVLEANQERPGPTISRFLRFCYSYDPAGRRYYVNVTRVAAGFTVVLAAGFAVALAARKGKGKKTAELDTEESS